MNNRTFKFPDRAVRIAGDRQTGKTTKCANIVVTALMKNQQVLVVLPQAFMRDIFQNYCKNVAVDCEVDHMVSWFKMDIHILTMGEWSRPDIAKIYDLIIFVDGTAEVGASFHGHNWLFGASPELWQILDYHTNHVILANKTLPEIVVACNPVNLAHEPAQIWLNDLARIQRGGEPAELLKKFNTIGELDTEVAYVVTQKLSARLV